MLISKNLKDRKYSVYECDRCKNKVDVYNTFKIYVMKPKKVTPKKQWDLCNKCYRALVRGTENGRNN